MKSDISKENIIQQTICLIQESDGIIENITIRKIAERSNVGVGLVNHYFMSKENLIEICVQTIISGVIGAFQPDLSGCQDFIETTKTVAKQVMDFLMENQQISKVSILGDLKQPKVMDNTMKTVMGFATRLSGGQITQEYKVKAFMITAVLQEAFLRKDCLNESLAIDFYDKEQRDVFINDIVERFA
ncbi:MAG: regulatory protein TetR [Oscillospiraceae bacterium]|jgi:AcrR family transcriptional regulator|nr:regulatory protein TetR [Oscillospiraceae bacterium]